MKTLKKNLVKTKLSILRIPKPEGVLIIPPPAPKPKTEKEASQKVKKVAKKLSCNNSTRGGRKLKFLE